MIFCLVIIINTTRGTQYWPENKTGQLVNQNKRNFFKNIIKIPFS